MKLKKILKYIFFLILLVVIGFLYGFSNQRNSQQIITKSVVKFHSKEPYFLSEQIVNKLLIQNNATVKKQAKSVIDLYKLEEQLLENPYVEKVSLFITIDGKLNTFIKQREPIARILSENSSYYVDSQGIKVPISENFSARVPVISGISNENEVSKLMVLLNKLVNDDFLSKEIIGIEFKNQNEYIFTVRSGNYRINFGDLTDIEKKTKKLKAFYSKVFLDSTIHKYKTINIKYHNQVVGEKITGYGK
ncbi:MAG: cell division protein FtsQ/DivIB [Flavobacteriaceae bacterium]